MMIQSFRIVILVITIVSVHVTLVLLKVRVRTVIRTTTIITIVIRATETRVNKTKVLVSQTIKIVPSKVRDLHSKTAGQILTAAVVAATIIKAADLGNL